MSFCPVALEGLLGKGVGLASMKKGLVQSYQAVEDCIYNAFILSHVGGCIRVVARSRIDVMLKYLMSTRCQWGGGTMGKKP